MHSMRWRSSSSSVTPGGGGRGEVRGQWWAKGCGHKPTGQTDGVHALIIEAWHQAAVATANIGSRQHSTGPRPTLCFQCFERALPHAVRVQLRVGDTLRFSTVDCVQRIMARWGDQRLARQAGPARLRHTAACKALKPSWRAPPQQHPLRPHRDDAVLLPAVAQHSVRVVLLDERELQHEAATQLRFQSLGARCGAQAHHGLAVGAATQLKRSCRPPMQSTLGCGWSSSPTSPCCTRHSCTQFGGWQHHGLARAK